MIYINIKFEVLSFRWIIKKDRTTLRMKNRPELIKSIVGNPIRQSILAKCNCHFYSSFLPVDHVLSGVKNMNKEYLLNIVIKYNTIDVSISKKLRQIFSIHLNGWFQFLPKNSRQNTS